MMGNGVNLLFMVASGPAGKPPILGSVPTDEMADPLPQALVLTAVVIALGTTAFVLAMAHRNWQLNGNDDVQDDVEDAMIRGLAAADDVSDSHELSESVVADRSEEHTSELQSLMRNSYAAL